MEWVETTGRTVEEAKDAALDQLGVDEQDAEFDVIEEPKTGLVERLGSQAEVTSVDIEEDTVEVRVDGSDLWLLIGPRGQTLSAVQDLARTVVQRQTGGANGRLLVDVSGYRQKRRAALERF